MLLGLVRPVKRSGSRNPQFVQRSPADVRCRAAGLALNVPLGDETVRVVISPTAASVRFSLRTADDGALVEEPSDISIMAPIARGRPPMRFIAFFEDAVDPATLDPALNARHFEYLRDRRDEVVLAGGLRPDAGAPFAGALWIIEAEDRLAAIRLVEGDPYTEAGLWKTWRVLAWGKAPGTGPVTL